MDPNKGMATATIRVLMSKEVPTSICVKLLLYFHEMLFLIAMMVGERFNAYLVIGLIKVVYIATYELNLPPGRFKVTCDFTSSPNIKYPKTATAA